MLTAPVIKGVQADHALQGGGGIWELGIDLDRVGRHFREQARDESRGRAGPGNRLATRWPGMSPFGERLNPSSRCSKARSRSSRERTCEAVRIRVVTLGHQNPLARQQTL